MIEFTDGSFELLIPMKAEEFLDGYGTPEEAVDDYLYECFDSSDDYPDWLRESLLNYLNKFVHF